MSLFVWIVVTTHRAAIYIPSLEGEGGYDGTLHENMARITADGISNGQISFLDLQLFSNEGYQSLLGIFYAFTGAPNFAAVAIHSLMAYVGLLFILESVALTVGQRIVPKWMVAYTMFLPSAIIFTPWLLKEGPVLWGIGILMRANVAPSKFFSTAFGVLLASAGAMILFAMRPHIAAAWIIAAVIGHCSPFKRPIISLLAIIASLLCYGLTIAAIEQLSPGFSDQVSEQGLTNVLDKATDHAQGGSAIVRQSTPIPFVNGLIFILAEPNPIYWLNINYAIVGLEAWFITIMNIYLWKNATNRVGLLITPRGTMCVVAIMSIGFYLGYMYNMGLMVRQRLQVMPALILLAAVAFRENADKNIQRAPM